jgi:hypothetical protein
MVRTIPKPSNAQFSVALSGLIFQAKQHGLDTTDPKVNAYLNNIAEFNAQKEAEITWLRNILHPRKGS